MKIDSTLTPSALATNNRQQTARTSIAAQPSSESVSLSSTAGALQGSEKPPVNLARIQEIKEAISQGRFKINPEAIADSLIDTARNLVNGQRKA